MVQKAVAIPESEEKVFIRFRRLKKGEELKRDKDIQMADWKFLIILMDNYEKKRCNL